MHIEEGQRVLHFIFSEVLWEPLQMQTLSDGKSR